MRVISPFERQSQFKVTLTLSRVTGKGDKSCARARRVFGSVVSHCVFSRHCWGGGAICIRPFDSDGAMFIYMGRLISEGGRFGHELIDNKFPTVGLITSVPWRWFGPVWRQYVLLETAMSLLMACRAVTHRSAAVW